MSDVAQRKYVDFVIKVYPEGKMTQSLDALSIGDRVLFKGPRGRFQYGGAGAYKSIGMLAGGTGVAPMFQLVQAILKDPNDHTQASTRGQEGRRAEGQAHASQGLATWPPSRLSNCPATYCLQVSLVFGNLTEEDILLRQELQDLADKHDNFTVGTLPWEGHRHAAGQRAPVGARLGTRLAGQQPVSAAGAVVT